jgi:hypothetical protein
MPDLREDLAHGVGCRGDPQFRAVPHVLRNRRELAAETAGGVKPGELLGGKLSLFEQDECQGVAERDHHRRAGTGRKCERAGFGDGTVGDRRIRAASESTRGVASDRANACRERLDGAEQAKQFLRFAAVREKKSKVIRMDRAQVAVDGASGIERVGARAGRVERPDEFLPDIRGLADTRHRHPAAAIEEVVRDALEAFAEPAGNRFERS